VAGKPGERPIEEGDGVLLAFARQDLGVGEPRGVVDGDVQVLPADALDAIAPVAGDAGRAMRPSFLVSMWMSSPGRSRS
jgi:hypothetical protein